MCISCKTTPFNQQSCSLAVFTKCRTDVETVPTLELTAAQIKGVNSFDKLFLEIVQHLPLTNVASKITTVAVYSNKYL